MKAKDIHSFADPFTASVTHLLLDIKVNFEEKNIEGKASWKIETAPGASRIVFDSHNLGITKVTLGKEEKTTRWNWGTTDKILGTPLEVEIEPETEIVNLYFHTTEGAEALQWLNPSQTAGKKKPFLFTQSQAILARTWLPCQDSPGIRFTYEANVEIPTDLLAVMSASNPKVKNPAGKYHFEMKQPIPSYLMALAVGDFEFRSVGQRTGVYAEPVTLEKAVYEFGEMEAMLIAAEELYGPYRWDQYDLIVLPPSFPFGGMENPRITFATPTILAGDRSLTSLVAHELAHSWSGNLVTNATWNDFWLNEGFTVYFERRIMEKLYGREYYEMLSVLGFQELQGTIDRLMKENPSDTKLKLDLSGRTPDEGLTDIAYEKGNFFLTNIERTIGREKFDAFLRKYFDTYAFQVMTTEAFVNYLKIELIKDDSVLAGKINLDKWIFGDSLPKDFAPPTAANFLKVDSQLKSWESGTPPEKLEVKGWSTHEWLHFLRHLPTKMNAGQMESLDRAFGFTKSGNSEILGAWFPTVIANNYKGAFGEMEKFLVNVGRRKFVKPLYMELVKTPENKQWAMDVFEKAEANYHSITAGTVREILKTEIVVK